MTFRLRTIEFTAEGRRIVRDRDVAGDALAIGRSAENAIHLPDLAVDPVHARITRQGRRLAVAAAGSLGFGLDGRSAMAGEIDPETGAELRFGSFRIAVSQADDGAALLTIEQVEEEKGDLDAKAGFSLASVLPGKRAMSWVLAVVVLLAFLALPVWNNLTRGDAPKRDTVWGDAAWSSGKLSLAHHSLENKCEACHVKPFEPVQDATCATCHKDLHDHARPERLAGARGPGSLGDRVQWSVAHAFGKPGPGACSDCHTEHEGAKRMEPAAQAFCADCHGSLDSRLTDTKLGNAADFGTLHPQFRPAAALTLGSEKLTRVSLADRPKEASGLIFPHDLHLSKTGGVARMAARIGADEGYGQQGLACKDCHRPTADKVRFEPIDMERDCQACHSLAYDKVGDTFRRLRHGDVDQMIADLSVTSPRAEPIVTGRRRPGEFASGGTYFARFAPASSGLGVAARALSRDGICGECHLPAASGGRFAVMPVVQAQRFMHHGWFNHEPHKQEKCTSCHVAATSKTSADLLLPDLKSCRTCHEGEGAKQADVPSSCAMCHDYHISPQAPKGAGVKKKIT